MAIRAIFVLLVSLAAAMAQQDQWWTWMQRGSAMERAGDYAGAAASFRAALHLATAGDPRQVTLAATALAGARAEIGDFRAAVKAYDQALASTAPDSADRGVVLGSLGSLEMEMGHRARGESLLRESLATIEGAVPADDERLATARNNLAEALIEQKQFGEAEILLLQAESRVDAAGRGIVLNNLGLASLGVHRAARAIERFRAALAAFDGAFAAGHPYTARIWNNLGTALMRSGDSVGAEAAYRNGLRIAESKLGEGHALYAALLRNYAATAKKNGRKDARQLADRAAAITREQSLRDGSYGTVDVSAFQGGN